MRPTLADNLGYHGDAVGKTQPTSISNSTHTLGLLYLLCLEEKCPVLLCSHLQSTCSTDVCAIIKMFQSAWMNVHEKSESNVHTQELTISYVGAGNNIQIGINDNTKKWLTNRSNTRTPSRNIELYHLDKWTTPLMNVQELYN
jgi:hypothetical protein